MRSDIYLEKVNRWMDGNIIYENNCDDISLGTSEMLREIVHDGNMDESYISISQCITIEHSEDLPSPVRTSDISNACPSSRCSSISRDQLRHAKTKNRMLSTDSGVDCACQEYGSGKEHNSTVTGVTVIQHHQPLLDTGDLQLIAADIAKDEYVEVQISDDSDSSSVTEDIHCNFEQDICGSLLGSTAGLSHYFDPEASKEREDDDEYPYIQNSGICTEQCPITVTEDRNRKTNGYFGCEVMQSKNAEFCESNELTLSVAVGDYVKSTSVETSGGAGTRYKSTMETGEYIKLEAVNQSRDTLASDFADELESTVEAGDYVNSNIFDDSNEKLDSKSDQRFSTTEAPRDNSLKLVTSEDVVGLRSTEAVDDYIKSTSVKTSGEADTRYKSTMETGEYIKLEAVNQSRDTLESDFADEFESTVKVGDYVNSNIFDDSNEKLDSKSDQRFSSPEAPSDNSLKLVTSEDVVGLRSTEAVGDYIGLEHAKGGDVEKSGDLGRHETGELCHYVKHCNSVDIEHPRSPDPVEYMLNDDGYIINQD